MLDQKSLEDSFERHVDETTKRLYRETRYFPTFFMQMVADHGAVGAAKRLIMSQAPAEGFVKLYDLGRLDMTVEAFAVLPWWASLFTEEERAAARARLTQYGQNVDRIISGAAAPEWWGA